MVNQPRRRVASHQSTAQGFDREIALQAVRYQEEKRRAGVVVSTKEAVDAVMGCEL